jgi:hypothetical protein
MIVQENINKMFYNYSEINNKSYHQNNIDLCIHIESTTLADGTNELVPEPESEQHETQINLTEVAEVQTKV